jgi:hypothetical protein
VKPAPQTPAPQTPAATTGGWRRVLGRIGLVLLAYVVIFVVAANNQSLPLLILGWACLTAYWIYRLVRRK